LWATNNIFAVPAVRDGSYVFLSPDAAGAPKMLVIENVCSGLRSLISLIWFASLFAVVCRTKGWWRVFMLAMAIPVAVLSNVVRITSLNLVAHYYSVDAAGPGSWFHDLSGLLVFAMALAILFGVEQVIILLGRWLKRDWVDLRLLGFLEGVPRGGGHRHGGYPVAPLGVLSVVAVLSLYWSVYAWDMGGSQDIPDIVPRSIAVDGATFVGEDQELDPKSLVILEYPDYLYRRYIDPDTGRFVDLLIVFSANNRKGTHPPEVCIEGGGEQITTKRVERIHVAGMDELALKELFTQRSNRRTWFFYTYKSGSRYTPSFFVQQFWVFANGLMGRNSGGALIRFSTSADPRDAEPSRRLVLGVVETLMPHIDKGLP
jgi:EpsI family protein